ncbi:ParB N-terminal domain-containing protein [uncultured Gimesia sp.]|uniref:ParB N-terminal domain-containing protein n=1 Tax=uncultured Gimesia sp. TaxID=1678688 RepID=UPI00262C3B6F|nr:ParB N-terminal domain-containing protein [uncultured Gimesia sp.]
MKIRDRIKSLKRIPASSLVVNEKNWRRHTDEQRSAIRTVMNEIGFASACLMREMRNGKFELIDGHLRVDIADDEKVPCLILDVTAKEADKILATFDSLALMAETEQHALDSLLNSISTESDEFRNLIDSMSIGITEDVLEKTVLKEIEVKPPPKMSWVLVGIPTVHFALISEMIEQMADMDSTIVETSVSD